MHRHLNTFLILFFLIVNCGLPFANAENPESRPNILFILADDQSPFTLQGYGGETCVTPNINRLASEGIRIDNAYHMGSFSGAVCTPSRHMIMSGRTVWHIPNAPSREQVLWNLRNPGVKNKDRKRIANPNIPEGLENNTLAAVFNRAGYETMRTCKKGNSYPAANRQFSIVADMTRRQGNKENGSAWHADQVVHYLDKRKAKDNNKPFLIYMGFSHPHDPRNASEERLARHGSVNAIEPNAMVNPKAPRLPINYLPAHPFHHGHPGLRDEVNVQGVKENRDEATVRNEIGREAACIENIDEQVGRVIKKLTDIGEYDNTYIVYTSDHGIAVGRHGLMGKQNLYEHTWRVPYLVKGPGIKPGSAATGNIYLLDTLATLCDLAGIEAPNTNEGQSFEPILFGEQDTVREVLYGTYSGGTKPGMRCVRKGDWKLIKYEVLDGKVRETQLFNLQENPAELIAEHNQPDVIKRTGNTPQASQRDLAEDPAYADRLREMEALLLQQMELHNDPYRFDEQ